MTNYENVFKMFKEGSVGEGGGEQGSVYGIDLCNNIVLRSSPNARTESGSKMRCLPPTSVAYTKKEARAEWGKSKLKLILAEAEAWLSLAIIINSSSKCS